MQPDPRLLTVAVLAAALSACAGETQTTRVGAPAAASHAADATAADTALRGPFLWRVEGKAGPSFLFGTIHAGFEADTELPQLVWDRLAASETFIMEADISAVDPVELMRLATLPSDQSLDALLGEADWQTLRVMVGSGIPTKVLKSLAPWMAYSLIMQTLHPTPVPLDLALQLRAKELGKQMTYLEDWRFQVGVLSETMGIEDLRELVAGGPGAREQLGAMISAYRAGDFGEIGAIAFDPAETARHPERIERMFGQRNRAWVRTLGPGLRAGRLFVAVGVGHFAGEAGLLSLLRAEGHVIHRVAR